MKKGIFLLISLFVLTAQTSMAGDFTDKLGLGFTVGGQKMYGDAETGYFETGGSPLVFRFNCNPFIHYPGNHHNRVANGYFIITADINHFAYGAVRFSNGNEPLNDITNKIEVASRMHRAQFNFFYPTLTSLNKFFLSS